MTPTDPTNTSVWLIQAASRPGILTPTCFPLRTARPFELSEEEESDDEMNEPVWLFLLPESIEKDGQVVVIIQFLNIHLDHR